MTDFVFLTQIGEALRLREKRGGGHALGRGGDGSAIGSINYFLRKYRGVSWGPLVVVRYLFDLPAKRYIVALTLTHKHTHTNCPRYSQAKFLRLFALVWLILDYIKHIY